MKLALLLVPLLAGASFGAVPVKIDPACPVYRPSGSPAGTRTTIGSDSLAEEMRLWAGILHAAHPGVTIVIEPKGSDLAAKTLIDGTSQFAYCGRTMPQEEVDSIAKAWGYPPLRMLVSGPDFEKPSTTHPQVVWVNADNPLRSATLEQVDAIFSQSRRRGAPEAITTWGQLGLSGDWAQAPIHKFALNATGGPGIYLKETLLLGGERRSDVQDIREEKVIPEGVAKDRFAIGLTGLPYGTPQVRALALSVNDSGGFVEPTFANVLNRSYPLSRFNYLYVNKAPGKPLDPVIKELLHVVFSRQGQEAAVKAHYLPLSSDLLLEELALVDAM